MRRRSRIAAALALALVLPTCATNPVTGKREISLVGEGSEISMGREADQQVAQAIGFYEDAELQRYVSDIGLRLARASERPNLPWTFRVLDDPGVNAMALPGGYIYVTRGMLAHMSSEAQLAGVLGHEIGHVTARHSASQITRSQLASIGLVAGMIIRPELAQFGELAQGGLQLLFLKYSRDHEKQADDLGLKYMASGGYDPSGMPEVFRTLQKLGEAENRGRVPGWLSTHPDPGDRATRLAAAAAKLPGRDGREDKDAYLARLDGMMYGINPREGYFDGSTFYHPDLRFRLDMPAGWETNNQKQSVAAMSPQRDAMFALTMARRESPEQAAREFFSQQGIQQGRASRSDIGGQPAISAEFQAQTQQGVLRGLVSFVELEGRVYQLIGYSSAQRWSRYARTVEGAAFSFDRLTDRRRIEVEAQRLDIVRVPQPLTVGEFEQRFPSDVPAATVALLNQLDPGERVQGSAKRVLGTPFQAKATASRTSR